MFEIEFSFGVSNDVSEEVGNRNRLDIDAKADH